MVLFTTRLYKIYNKMMLFSRLLLYYMILYLNMIGTKFAADIIFAKISYFYN